MDPIRVLLIDDDPTYHTLTTRMLSRADRPYLVEWVGTYDEGLAAMQQDDYDIYLLDYSLGGTSGIDLLRAARDGGLLGPVIVMTGHGKRGLDVEALQAGATDYIDKVELRPATLQRSIRYALERAKIIQSQRESEELYRSLIEEAFDGILIANYEGTILLANDRLGQLSGQDTDDLVGKNVRDIIMPVDADQDVLAVGDGTLAEGRLRYGKDDIRNVEISARRTSGRRFQFIVRDISGRQASLAERDQYIEQLTILRQVDEELSQVLSIEYVLSMALDAAVRLSGADGGFIGLMEEGDLRIKQTIGQYASLLRQESLLPTIPSVQRLIQDQVPRLVPDVDADPDYLAIHQSTRAQMLLPLLSSERLVGILNLESSRSDRFNRDTFDLLQLITSRVAVAIENAQLYTVAQERFNELQAVYTQVSELEQLKTDMIRIAAHDIRNPVSVILGYAELMQATAGDEIPQRFLSFINMIERAARRLEKITTDILSLERIENQQANSDSILNITTLVNELVEDFEGQARLKSQTLSLASTEDEHFVRGDSAQMREAIANLINNAIKYTQEGGEISVGASVEDDMVAVRVIDNGYGVPEEQQASLFQPFFRATSMETKDIEGTGLGLYLIKSIVDRYGGSLIFQSKYGQGSTFGFRLPEVDKRSDKIKG
ncbi:MAG: ATP-binding protein [Chloroflexota bacterium]